MGLKRKMGQCTLGFVMATCPIAAGADTAREPLVVTTLADPELLVVAPDSDGRAQDPVLEGSMRDFATAISQAAAADQESIVTRCKSVARVPAGGADRVAWEANCRYLRH